MIRIYYSDVINDIYLDWSANYEDPYEDIRFDLIMKRLKEDDRTKQQNL